jgi:hypothetical protein
VRGIIGVANWQTKAAVLVRWSIKEFLWFHILSVCCRFSVICGLHFSKPCVKSGNFDGINIGGGNGGNIYNNLG